MDIGKLLQHMVTAGASDLHLAVPNPPMLRVRGKLQPMQEHGTLTPEDVEAVLRQVAATEAVETFRRQKELDFPYSLPGIARFRVNASFQRGTIALSFRPIPFQIPPLGELGLPEICQQLVTRPRGMVLVTGPTGSGKSTSLASMVEFLNEHHALRIVTIEDPVEFLHRNKQSMIIQRELGTDTLSFATALRQALRQDPDVILVGELRDLETISLALTASETGHLVLGTLHTNGALQTIERIVDVFPAAQQPQVQVQLSMVLEGIISQLLLPRKDAQGRVAAFEVMVATPAIRNLIRQNQMHQVRSYIQMGSRAGMQTLEQSLARLVKDGVITVEEARARAADPKDLDLLLGSVSLSPSADPFPR